jgi:AraC-like DNA-binding protein
VDLGVDVALGFAWKPQWFTIAQNAAILLVTVQTIRWLLRTDVGKLSFRPDEPQAAGTETVQVPIDEPPADVPDARLLRRLNELMETEHLYRDPQLTFTAFVERMGAPEAEVRRLINRQLGHRHFRSFLNAYRVAEARQILADPARANQKMVAIAFDVGFASLASFNRAFKLVEGRPPSDAREQPGSDDASPSIVEPLERPTHG